MEKRSIRDVFGVDFLLDKPPATKGEQSELFRFMAQGVLRWLMQQSGNAGGLYDVVRSTGVDLKQLFGIVDYLTSQGLVEVTKRDPLGNTEIKITEQGKQFLQYLAR
jgi:hypothetical protein